MDFPSIVKDPSRKALEVDKDHPSRSVADSKSPFVNEGSAILILSFFPLVPSNVASIVPTTSAEVPLPTNTSDPTTDTSFNMCDAVPTVLNFVVSLLRDASSKIKSI